MLDLHLTDLGITGIEDAFAAIASSTEVTYLMLEIADRRVLTLERDGRHPSVIRSRSDEWFECWSTLWIPDPGIGWDTTSFDSFEAQVTEAVVMTEAYVLAHRFPVMRERLSLLLQSYLRSRRISIDSLSLAIDLYYLDRLDSELLTALSYDLGRAVLRAEILESVSSLVA